jgi:hypothetical protein
MTDPTTPDQKATAVTIQVAGASGGDSLDLPKLASILAGIGFTIGLLYNLGFFLALDVRLFPLLTYKDHLETLVLFAPIAVVPILLCLSLRRNPVRRRQMTIGAGGLAAAAVGAWTERDEIAGSPALYGFALAAVGLAAFLLVVYCAAVILDRGLELNAPAANEAGRDDAIRAMSFAILGLLVFVTLLGGAAAHGAMQGAQFNTQVAFTGEGAAAVTRPARLVRVIDNGLLVVFRDAPGQIAYVRNESVRNLSEPARP